MAMILRVTPSAEIKRLLEANADVDIVTPLELFDNDESDDEENIKKYEIYIENDLEKSKSSDKMIGHSQKKEVNNHGKSNDTGLERH